MAALSTRYRQIAEDLRRRIESREFAAGAPLPSEAELQVQYQASRNTVREAVKLLAQQHLVETRAGQGTLQHIADALGLRQVGYRDLILARLPDSHEQSLFNLTPNHTVLEVYRTSFAEDETPLRVTVTIFPSDRNQVVYDIGVVPDLLEEQA
jgi:GntR family transcriptional regulator